jgi:hypothetical protein
MQRRLLCELPAHAHPEAAALLTYFDRVRAPLHKTSPCSR